MLDEKTLREICLAIAGMSATVGSVVAIFTAFASQELRHNSATNGVVSGAQIYQDMWNKSRTAMLAVNGTISISVLMLTAVLGTLGAFHEFMDLEKLAAISFFAFAFGIYTILLALIAYIFQERD